MPGPIEQQAPQQMPQGVPKPPRQATQQSPQQEQAQGPGQQSEALMDAMTAYLYEDGLERTKEVLTQGEDIVERMAMVIGTTMTTAYNTLTQAGKTVDPRAMVRTGMEMSRAVGEMAETMGRLEPGDSEQIEMAFMSGLAKFGQQAKGMPDEERQAYGQIIDTLMQAKEGGGAEQQPQPQGQPQPQQPRGGLLQQGAM